MKNQDYYSKETIKNEAKEQKGEFLRMLLGILAASLLRSVLAGQGSIKAGEYSIDSKFNKEFRFLFYVIDI